MEVSARTRLVLLILVLLVVVVGVAAFSFGVTFIGDAVDFAGKACTSGCSI